MRPCMASQHCHLQLVCLGNVLHLIRCLKQSLDNFTQVLEHTAGEADSMSTAAVQTYTDVSHTWLIVQSRPSCLHMQLSM